MSLERKISNEATKQLVPNWRSYEKNETDSTIKEVTFRRTKVPDSSLINSNNEEQIIKNNVTLIVNNEKINVQKDILVSNSDYFDRMFTSSFKERDQDKIEINIADVSCESLVALIEYFQSGLLTINENNVQELLIGSNVFLLDDVREACVDFLKSMIAIENCINMKDFANSLGLNDLYSSCLTYILNNFRFLAHSQDFMTISYEEIMLFIKDDNLFAKEEQVYDVVMNWIKHDPASRSQYSPELLWYVRLPLVLNTYQGIIKVHEFQGARINGLSSFRMEHRKPFRKGILMLSHFPSYSLPEWYDAALDQWQNCLCENCQCKNFQTVLLPPRNLCTFHLLDDGRLFTAGGNEYGHGMRLATIYDSNEKGWALLPNMNCDRIKPYIVQIGWKVFVVGGIKSLKPLLFCNTMEYYDLNKKKWFSIKSKLKGISALKNDTVVTSVNGLIYIMGMNAAGFYNPISNSWHCISKLPEKKEGSAICTLNNNIYVIGGHNGDKYLKSVWVYCTETQEWISVANLNSPRSYAGAVAMNGVIYVFGGKTGRLSYSNTFETYNPDENEWVTSNALLPSGRCYIDAIVVDKSCDMFKKVFGDNSDTVIH